MSFNLPALPFAPNALSPYISEETVNFHYGKHHKAYVDNLNKLIIGTEFEHKNLNEIIKSESAVGSIFNNAAQIWNHNFYWNCLKHPDQSGNKPSPKLSIVLDKFFGGVDKFKEEFTKASVSLFGSGWVWLVQENTNISIFSTENAKNPLLYGKTPLLVCDVWEHAYYIDYRNARAKYIEAFWNIVNWDFVEKQFVNI